MQSSVFLEIQLFTKSSLFLVYQREVLIFLRFDIFKDSVVKDSVLKKLNSLPYEL
jgi:hypothetical protein